MDREELKKLLIEKGVDPRLTEMPAIVEPLLATVMFVNPIKLKESDLIQVRKDGTYKLGERIVKLNEDGTATVTSDGKTSSDDYVITVNKEGIEVSYSDGNELFLATSITRNNGMIDDVFMNNGSGTYSSSKYFDNGHWSIKNAAGYKMRDTDDMPCEFDEEKVCQVFEETSKNIKLNYPNTVDWYEKTEKELESKIAEEKDPIKRRKLIIAVLKHKKKNLEYSNSSYTDRIEGKLKKLGLSLECIEKIKRNPLGKAFFADGLEAYYKNAESKSAIEEEKKAEEDLKLEKERQAKLNKKNKDKMENGKKEADNVEALEQEKKDLEDSLKILELENKVLRLRYVKISNMNYFAEEFIGKVKKSFVGKKIFVANALKGYNDGKKKENKKIKSRER